MKTRLVVVTIAFSMLIAACGNNSGGGGGTIDKGMLDAIQGYTESMYQAKVDRFPAYICKEHVDTMTKQVQDTGIPPSTSGNTYDISGITFKVDSINGDVAKLSIVSGELKVTVPEVTVGNNGSPKCEPAGSLPRGPSPPSNTGGLPEDTKLCGWESTVMASVDVDCDPSASRIV